MIIIPEPDIILTEGDDFWVQIKMAIERNDYYRFPNYVHMPFTGGGIASVFVAVRVDEKLKRL